MRQFDVYANPSARTRSSRPYVLVLQHSRWAASSAIVVAPFARASIIAPSGWALPGFAIAGLDVTLLPNEIAAINRVALVGQVIDNLEAYRLRIITAIDQLF